MTGDDPMYVAYRAGRLEGIPETWRADVPEPALRKEFRGWLHNVSYPEFCSQPSKCWGAGSCRRDPSCID